MNVVMCWCCQKYLLIDDQSIGNEIGFCELKGQRVKCDENVCCDFVLRKGLYTKRNIPDYCKNYKQK
ncbi:MAG: hypothetical protein IJ370_08060 [Oscillospiraceae bacterium]|nr:hypothetical protein [Oscillospiraceae bacterium]